MTKKIMVVASKGGHVVQLSRLFPAFSECETLFVSTTDDNPFPNIFINYVKVKDCNFDKKINFILCCIQTLVIVLKERPDVILSTGAAPGLAAILVGWILRKKIIWIDSIANAEEMSFAGKIANKLTPYCLTQWPELVNDNGPMYIGRVI